MNDIMSRQDSPAMLRLMRARRVYGEAERWQTCQLAIVLGIPIVAAVLGLMLPTTRPLGATVALGTTMLDVWLIDGRQRDANELASWISEMFDYEMLQLTWNDFVVGRRPIRRP